MEDQDTLLGISENLEAMLCYLGLGITGIIFLILERNNRFVRFHAIQSMITSLGLVIFFMLILLIPIPLFGLLLLVLFVPMGFGLWLLLMYKAFSGEVYKMPVLGNWTERQFFRGTVSEGEESDV